MFKVNHAFRDEAYDSFSAICNQLTIEFRKRQLYHSYEETTGAIPSRHVDS